MAAEAPPEETTVPGDEVPAAQSESRPRARAPEGELLSAISALLLLVAMFALKWYGVISQPTSPVRAANQTAASAWNELSDVRWLLLLTALVPLASVVIHLGQRSHGSMTNTSPLIAWLGGITAVLLIYRVLISLPSPATVVDAKLGALLGLVATVGVAFGGIESVRASHLRPAPRARRRSDLASRPRAR